MLRSKGYKGFYILNGGLNAWKEKVLFPKAPINGSKDKLRQLEKMKEVNKFFGVQVQKDSSFTESRPSFKLPVSYTGTQ